MALLNPAKTSTMEEVSSPPKPTSKPSCCCDECGVNPSKYKCPGCSIRSCSLPCVKSHKQRTSCTGKRPRTQFVPLSQFDDNLLLSDYQFLEEARRVSDAARRSRDGLPDRFYFKIPYKLKVLKNAAAARKTHLLFLPTGMSKRDKNQTHFRKNCISWTLEWRFHPADLVIIDNGVDENASLYSVIEKHLEPSPWSTQLKSFCEQLDSLKFFIRKNAKGTKSPYRELDIKAPLRHQLAKTVIVEYPVIHVFLPSVSPDFEIVKDIEPFSQICELKEPVNDSFPSPKGVLFREEEVEDDTSDPRVLDLMTYMNPELADIEPLAQHNEGHDAHPGFAETFDFGFEQDLRDAFSGLISDANPDEFLDFDGIFGEGLMIDDELEEGEIPTF